MYVPAVEGAKVVRTLVIVGLVLGAALYLQYRDGGSDVPEHLRACGDWDLVAVGDRRDDLLRGAMLCLHNVERERHDLPALRRNARLERAAQAHADDMAEREFFDHVTPDGVEPDQRMRRAGYRGRLVAENLAHGDAEAGAPGSMLDGWMHSPGHRKNILHPRLREIGIGIGHDGRRTYWVANFGAP